MLIFQDRDRIEFAGDSVTDMGSIHLKGEGRKDGLGTDRSCRRSRGGTGSRTGRSPWGPGWMHMGRLIPAIVGI